MNSDPTLLGELVRTAHQAGRTWRLLTFGQRAALMVAVVLMAGVGFLTAQIPLVLGELVDAMLEKHINTMAAARPYLVALAGAYLAREFLQVLRKVLVERTCTTVGRDATIKAVSQLLVLDLSVLLSERAGTLNGRLNRSVEGLIRLLKLSFLDFLPAVFGAAFALAAALHKDLWLGLAMAGVIPISLLVILTQLASQRGIRISLLRAKERMDGTIVEQIGGIESVRAANTFALEIAKVSKISEELRSREFKHHFAMALFDSVKSLNEAIFHIGIIAIALTLSLMGVISTGDILVFSILFLAVLNPLREIHRIMDEAHESGIRAEEFFSMLGQPTDISFTVSRPRSPELGSRVLVEAKHLGVVYPATAEGAEPSKPALRNVSLSVQEGEVIGLAGPSGSGKTTFVRSLLRLVHPTGGDLIIGGSRIEQIGRDDIGRMFGFVSQQPFLFAGTIRENITYGCPEVTPEAVRAAAALAQIDGEINDMPRQYDSSVAERGLNLSGGQRQRIALARVFLKGPPILIFDEATAALDNENERAVMNAIAAAVKDRTVFMVAHRLSSLKRADRIFVFKDGSIVEEGNYDGLSNKRGGVFAGLMFGPEADSGDRGVAS